MTTTTIVNGVINQLMTGGPHIVMILTFPLWLNALNKRMGELWFQKEHHGSGEATATVAIPFF